MDNSLTILDIGCGQKKLEGAIGIDFSPFSMADIVLDLNKDNLPFEDDSVDYIYSSHCLEHLTLEGFHHIISEIYRVSKPNGQIYITVPYYTNTANFANPFHNNQICFNEHTFRFFSSASTCRALEPIEYQTPTCPDWGLRYSANSEISIELETLKLEYLYFDEYKDLTNEEKRLARNKYLNVVETISYYLKAIKPAPELIKKESQFLSSHRKLIEEKLSYLRQQSLYFREQKKRLESNGILPKAELFPYEELKYVENSGNALYEDENGLLYPAVAVFFVYHDAVQRNQIVIDGLQKMIDNLNPTDGSAMCQQQVDLEVPQKIFIDKE